MYYLLLFGETGLKMTPRDKPGYGLSPSDAAVKRGTCTHRRSITHLLWQDAAKRLVWTGSYLRTTSPVSLYGRDSFHTHARAHAPTHTHTSCRSFPLCCSALCTDAVPVPHEGTFTCSEVTRLSGCTWVSDVMCADARRCAEEVRLWCRLTEFQGWMRIHHSGCSATSHRRGSPLQSCRRWCLYEPSDIVV